MRLKLWSIQRHLVFQGTIGVLILISIPQNPNILKLRKEKVYQWLFNNAGKFGFCQTYTAFDEQRVSGFHEERWHWSYMPTAKTIWEAQLRNFDESSIFRFKGYQAIQSLHLIDFVRNVNNCIQ